MFYFYAVGTGIILIIIGLFTLDPIKIIIGIVIALVAFLIYKSKLNKATKDPILFEMLKSITDINEEVQNKIRSGKNYSSSNNKYMGIILLIYVGFVKAASARSPIDKNKFKDLFYAAFTAINFSLKKELIDTLFNLQQDEKYKIAQEIILLGAITYSRKLLDQEYLNYCIVALDEVYNNPEIPDSIEGYFTKTPIKEIPIKHLEKKENTALVERLKSIENNQDAESIYNLGVAYANGVGIEKNEKKAVELWAQAAEMDYFIASYNLGNWYFHGREVRQDYKIAVEYYKKATDRGMLEAINNLANCYYRGLGVPIDNVEAARLYLLAAEKGFAESQYHLGNCYYFGHGVEKSNHEMFIWHKKAALQGHAEAECNLGIYYADGIGVRKDLNEAYNWFKKAATQGEERAINGLKMVEKELGIKN
ncbi:MAG: tetratricopeptide repeat protein [Candidatus Neomarinimicrobiota bacterium]